MFDLNTSLLDQVGEKLKIYQNIFWIIGGACSGKSTVSQLISQNMGMTVYDMDTHIFQTYMPKYTAGNHPASKAWFGAENPLDWVLSLSASDFNDLNKAANAEYLDLFADDMISEPVGNNLLVDGGITHPAVLAEVIPVDRICCLEVDPDQSAIIWNTDEQRIPMKIMILKLENGDKKWRQFLKFDRQISETIHQESRLLGIKMIPMQKKNNLIDSARAIQQYFLSGDETK